MKVLFWTFAEFHYELVRSLIISVSTATTGKDLSDPVVKQIVKDVFEHRYPDGLNLLERLWDWSAELKQGLKQTLKLALISGHAADKIVYEMQDVINRYTNQERAIVIKEKIPKWIIELNHAAKRVLENPDDLKEFEKIIKKIEVYTEKLSKEGTYYLTRLKTIARTESANAYHKAQIMLTEDDQDLVGYRWILSKSHPKPDICDYLANVNYGYGKGIHPKDKVPREKAHPNCMCYLEPVYKWDTKGKEKEKPKVGKKVLKRFAPKYVREFENFGYSVEDFFQEEKKRFLKKDEAMDVFLKNYIGENRKVEKKIGDTVRFKQYPRKEKRRVYLRSSKYQPNIEESRFNFSR